jgi:hypothetical protein
VTKPSWPRRVIDDVAHGRADDGRVVSEVAARPLSMREAERAVRDARDAIGRNGQAYARLRTGLDARATARAHTEFGFATLEFVNACLALAEAEDCVDPVWAAARNRSRPMFTVAGPRHDQAWSEYQEARRTGDQAAIAVARGVWRDVLVDWQLQLHKQRALEDEEHVKNLSRRLDESTRLHPGDAFPPPPRSRREEVVRASRERERQESIRRVNGDLGGAWAGGRAAANGIGVSRARFLSDPWI